MQPGVLEAAPVPPRPPGPPGPLGRPRRVVLGWVATAYGLVTWAALALVGLVGDRSAPTYVLGLVAFWWLVPALPLVLVAAVLRRWVAAAVLAVPTVLVLALLLPRHPLAGGRTDLRVATWNITGGAPVDDVYALVRARSPDVLVLQEVRPTARLQLAGLRARYPYESFAPLQDTAHWAQGDGSAVLSRYPITTVRHVRGLPAGSRPTDAVTLRVGARHLVVLSVHLASPCVGCPPGGGGYNASGGTGASARVRVGEARVLARVVRTLVRGGTPVVLAGDVNSSDLNRPLHVLTGAGLTDAWRAVGWGPGLTRGAWPGIARVDAVLVSGLRPVSVAVPGRGASTHAPVVTELQWR